MWQLLLWLLLALLPATVAESDSPPPSCALHCWENTKYVTKCTISDLTCLCTDVGFQNSVFRCLHSQCDTPKFGPGLQYAITQCVGTGTILTFGDPPTRAHDELRRREAEYLAGKRQIASGSAGPYPTESAGEGFPTQSAYYPTQSIWTSRLGLSASPSPSPFFLRRDDPDPEPGPTSTIASIITITTMPSPPLAITTTLPFHERVTTSTLEVGDVLSSGSSRHNQSTFGLLALSSMLMLWLTV